MGSVRVGVDVSDEIFRRGVTACLADEPGVLVVPADAADLDVLVVSSPDGVRPGIPVVVCSDDEAAFPGAAAVLPRATLSVDQLVAAVRAAAAGLLVRPADPEHRNGGHPAPVLAERELAVLRCIAEGMATRDISEQLGYSERTIKATIARACDRLGTHTRAQAVAESYRLHLL